MIHGTDGGIHGMTGTIHGTVTDGIIIITAGGTEDGIRIGAITIGLHMVPDTSANQVRTNIMVLDMRQKHETELSRRITETPSQAAAAESRRIEGALEPAALQAEEP